MSVYFHGNFGLNRAYMAGILKAGLGKPKVKDDQLAKSFGYRAPFAARHRAWLYRCGITEKGLPFKLTEQGEVLIKQDPNLSSTVSQWFIHHELTSDPERSETWHYFINEFLPGRKEFTRDELMMGLVEKLSAHSKQHFGMMSKMNPVIARKLIECYTEDGALGSLGFIRQSAPQEYKVNKVRPIGPWKSSKKFAAEFSG